jgi:transcriptional regulator with XRE-family HTH domain
VSTFSSRLEAVLEHLGITAYKMAKDLGVTAAAIGNFRAGKTNPSFDFVEKLLNCYPMINANWLIVNKGEMFTDPKMKANDKPQRSELMASQKEIIALQAENIKMKDQKIKELLDELKEYQKAGEYIKVAAKKREAKQKPNKR